LFEAGRLTELPGIGRTLARHIEEFARTGGSRYLQELRAGRPLSLATLPDQARLSPRRVLALHRALGVVDAPSLLAAAQAGRVRGLHGFGQLTEQRIIEALQKPAASFELPRWPVDRALLVAENVLVAVRGDATDARITGELRRAGETTAEVSLLIESDSPAPLDALARAPNVVSIDDRTVDRAVARTAEGERVVVRVAAKDGFGTALVEETGPVAHVVALAERSGGALPTSQDEEQVYAQAGLPFIPPEQRDRPDVIDAASRGETFAELVTADDLRGVIHCHTNFSDGMNTIEEMARAAEEMGFQYITITDHSPSAHYAHGVERDRLLRQWDEIAEVQSRVGIRLLRGTESDISREGALDYPDEILERLDVVIASVHTRFQLDADGMTERVVRAMRHPLFKIWGHPLGRLLLNRPPFACHVERILDAIATSRAAIEINGDPHRLDLSAEWVPAARARGISFVISSDAHSVRSLEYCRRWGVGVARRGGAHTREVLNTLPAARFMEAVRPFERRQRRRAG
jgi:DNA polymerase (family 10)